MIAPNHHKTRSPIPQIKRRSPPQPNTRSPIPSNQTAIAPHHPKPDRLFPKPKQRSPLTTRERDRPFPKQKSI